MISRPSLKDRVKPGSITAYLWPDSGDGTVPSPSGYNDLLTTGLTASITPQGTLRGPLTSSASANIIGTVFYDYGLILIHGADGTSWYEKEGVGVSRGLHFNSTSATNQLTCNLSFKSEKMIRRGQYFCHVFNKDANFSTNSTFANLTGTVESNLTANPTTFITSVGMLNDQGEMLAVAKVSPPVKKDFNSEAVFKVNLEY